MATRFVHAIQATQCTDLMLLARLLATSVKEVMDEPGSPGAHMDPAVRLIAFQIAFVGNGDLSKKGYYEEVYDYCALKAQNAPNAEFPQENKDVQPPVHQAS